MPILRSKIRPPALPPFAVPRPRLLERVLDPRLRVVLLHAPAGYGKSVLAGQIAAAAPRATAWLHLDGDEADPRRFCAYVAAAIAEVVPAIAGTELAATAERGPFEPERWAEDLLLFFDDVARTGCRLVLDNAEAIADAPGPLRCMQRWIEPGSERLRLTIASRRAPAVPLQRLIAQRRAVVLSEADLAFDLEEYRRAAGAHGLPLAGREVETAWEKSHGWCVMLGLGGARAPAAADGEAYLEEEVFRRLPDPLREFLVRTSVLDVVTPEGVAALGLGTAGTEEWFEGLAAHGVPHLPVGGGAGVRVHPLVRERLVGELRQRGDEAARLALRAAEYHRGEDRYEAAVGLLADLGRDEDALAMLHEDWDAIERLNLQPRIEEWLGRLAPRTGRHPLRVALMARYLRFMGETRRLADLLARSRDWIPADSPLGPQLWALGTWASTHLAEGAGYEERVAEWAAWRDRATPADFALAELSLANAALYDLRLEAAMAHVQTVLDALPPDATVQRASVRNAAAVFLQELGRSHEALAVHDQNIEECARNEEIGYLTLNMVGKAYVLKELGRYADALAAVDACLDATRRAGTPRRVLESHLARTRAECWWHLGRRREALAELERAFREFEDHNRFEALGTGVLIDHWTLVSGGTVEGHAAESDFADRPVSEPHVRYLIHRGRADAMRDRTDDARARLARAREIAHDMPAWQATAWLTEAWALRAGASRRDASRAALREGLTRLATIGAARYPMADPVLTAWVVAEAVAGEVEPGVAAALAGGGISAELAEAFASALAEPGRLPEEVARLVETAVAWRIRGLGDRVGARTDLPEELRDAYVDMLNAAPLPALNVRMFGPLQVTAAGRDVSFTRKASRAALEMLLIEYPQPVHEERLLAALWPDTAPRQATRSLQTAINELRKALDPFHRANGPSYVRFENEHYVLVLPPDSDVDLHRFRSELPRVVRDAATDASARADLQAALALWRGPLLADAPYAEHALEARERARALFLEGAGTLARAIAARDPREAIALLERGLEADPYWSEGVALLLSTLVAEGRVLAAVRWYRDYEARLERELGVPPDESLQRAVAPILGATDPGGPRR